MQYFLLKIILLHLEFELLVFWLLEFLLAICLERLDLISDGKFEGTSPCILLFRLSGNIFIDPFLMVQCRLDHGLQSLVRLCRLLYLHEDGLQGSWFLLNVLLDLWFIISDWGLFPLCLFLVNWLIIRWEDVLWFLQCFVGGLAAYLLIKLTQQWLVLGNGKWCNWSDHLIA